MLKIQITKPLRFLLIAIVAVFVVSILVFKIIWGNPEILITGEFTVNDGSSAKVVWTNLVEKGYLSNSLPLYFYSWQLDAANNLKSGTYLLQRGEHIKKVIARLVSGDASSEELAITYPEGFTLKQMAQRTEAQGIGTVNEFIAGSFPQAYTNQFPLLNGIPPNRDLEGYLFPDTYRIFIDDHPKDVIQRMLGNLNNKLSQELRDETAVQGRTIDQIIIMASIIEREVLSDKDMAIVSGILWKRFDQGMGLDVDATVRYALNKWDQPLTYQDLAIDSPYNTRKWRGLPPGPISNPGLRSIQAAIRPEDSTYYYYLSAPSGQTIFSKNLDEHNLNKAKYLK